MQQRLPPRGLQIKVIPIRRCSITYAAMYKCAFSQMQRRAKSADHVAQTALSARAPGVESKRTGKKDRCPFRRIAMAAHKPIARPPLFRCVLAREFAEEVYATIARIIEYPDAWSPLSQNTRRRLVKRFPFAVIYQVRCGIVRIIAGANAR